MGAEAEPSASWWNPPGGGAALFSQTILSCPSGTFTSDGGADETVDIGSVADQPVRIEFLWTVPELYTGPGDAKLVLP